MGSKLPVLAAIQVMLLAQTASADQAGDLFKQGIELYKSGKYPEAVAALSKSYKLDAKPEALFALAQAERLAGNCDAAIKHYRKMLDSSTDLNTAKLVETNLALCQTIKDVDKKDEPKPAPPPEPKVVVKAVPHTDKLATTMFASGMLGIGAAGGLYIASRTARSDAGRARTFDDYQSLSDRADRDQLMSVVVGGVSAALIGVAVFKWTRSPKEEPTLSVAPAPHGTTVSLTGRW